MTTSFFYHIKINYGTTPVHIMKTLTKNLDHLAKLNSKKVFMIKCRKFDICLKPKHTKLLKNLEGKCKYFDKKINKINNDINKRMLKIKVDLLFWESNQVSKQITSLKRELQKWIPNNLLVEFYKRQDITYNNYLKNYNTKRKNEFLRLSKSELKLNLPYNNDWFVNLTDTTVPPEMENLLSLGSKFALPFSNSKIPIFDIISDIELILKNIKSEKTKDCIRIKVAHSIRKFQLHNNTNKLDKLIFGFANITKRFLEVNRDIIVVPADKGNITVIMSKSEYESTISELLCDSQTYTMLKKT